MLIKATGVNEIAEQNSPGRFKDLNQVHREREMLYVVRGLCLCA